jgi:signal transduction histidine kinase
MGMADLLLETSLDDEQREYVNTTRLCAENLFEILNATLEYTALEAGQITLDDSEFSLREMLNAALGQHQAKAQAKNLPLSLVIEPGLPETMMGDALRLRELLGHLVGNAVKFTHSGKVEIHVRAETEDRTGPTPPLNPSETREGSAEAALLQQRSVVRASSSKDPQQDMLAIEVRDTGIGIAPGQLELIFQSFQQGQRGLTRSYPGLGLGLALARKLAALDRPS